MGFTTTNKDLIPMSFLIHTQVEKLCIKKHISN